MQTVVCTQPQQMALRDVPKPTCAPGEALLRIRRIGICGTDIHAFGGNQPSESPLVLMLACFFVCKGQEKACGGICMRFMLCLLNLKWQDFLALLEVKSRAPRALARARARSARAPAFTLSFGGPLRRAARCSCRASRACYATTRPRPPSSRRMRACWISG